MKKIMMAGLLMFSACSYAETDAEYSSRFQCPETMQTQEEYNGAIKESFDIAVKNHPDWKASDFLAQREKLLEEHHCYKTLENLKKGIETENHGDINSVDINSISGNMYVDYFNHGITAMTNRENECWSRLTSKNYAIAKECFTDMLAGQIIEATYAMQQRRAPAPFYSPQIGVDRAMENMGKVGILQSEIKDKLGINDSFMNDVLAGLMNAGMK
jgi:hypothetical protein